LFGIGAAIARWWRCLVFASGGTRWAFHPNMEMIVVPVPRPNFVQPRSITLFGVTHGDLCARENKYARNTRILCGCF
jgi:hypothetical protein